VLLDYSPEQRALRDELRAYFASVLTDDVRAGLGMPGETNAAHRAVIRRFGADGWLGVGWPREYGGQGRPPTDQFIFFEEAQRAGAPLPFVTLNTVGPTLMRFGTEQQKATYLAGILAGEIHFAIGYTEPDAGTDLASLRTRAVRDGDEYVINGSKVFTSGAEGADYIWLACRTDPDAPKHKGISMIIVPTDSPGFRATPITVVGGQRTTATYYENVRVPADNLVGPENDGWRLITTQLNHERVGLAALNGLAFRLWEDVLAWARETETGEKGHLLDLAWVRQDLASAHARLEAAKLLNWRLIADTAANALNPADASAAKVLGTETVVEVYRLLLGILGTAGYLAPGSPGAVLRGEVERASRAAQINTFGGGVNEIQREIVAALGLAMPRGSR
jgi:alkylation response protein AidB-like acyl-CoA dehydrogenase